METKIIVSLYDSVATHEHSPSNKINNYHVKSPEPIGVSGSLVTPFGSLFASGFPRSLRPPLPGLVFSPKSIPRPRTQPNPPPPPPSPAPSLPSSCNLPMSGGGGGAGAGSSSGGGGGGGGGGREGDWDCGSCGNRNYAFRSLCNRCKQPRLLVDPNTPRDSKWLPRAGDWICTGNTSSAALPFIITPALNHLHFSCFYAVSSCRCSPHPFPMYRIDSLVKLAFLLLLVHLLCWF
jgi:hypothetical protein